MQYCLQIKNQFFPRAVPGDTSDESIGEHIDFCKLKSNEGLCLRGGR